MQSIHELLKFIVMYYYTINYVFLFIFHVRAQITHKSEKLTTTTKTTTTRDLDVKLLTEFPTHFQILTA